MQGCGTHGIQHNPFLGRIQVGGVVWQRSGEGSEIAILVVNKHRLCAVAYTKVIHVQGPARPAVLALVAGGAGLKIAHGSPCDSRAVGGDKGYLAPSGRLCRALLTSQHLLSRVERPFSRRSFDRLSLCILLIFRFCDGTLVAATAGQHSLKRRTHCGRLSTHSTHLPTQHPCTPIQHRIHIHSSRQPRRAAAHIFPAPTSAPQPSCAHGSRACTSYLRHVYAPAARAVVAPAGAAPFTSKLAIAATAQDVGPGELALARPHPQQKRGHSLFTAAAFARHPRSHGARPHNARPSQRFGRPRIGQEAQSDQAGAPAKRSEPAELSLPQTRPAHGRPPLDHRQRPHPGRPPRS